MIAPLIDVSDTMELASATEEFHKAVEMYSELK